MNVASTATQRATERVPSRGFLYFLLCLMVFFWSLNFVIGKIALREFPAVLLAFMRSAMAAALMLAIYAATQARRRPGRWTAREFALLAVLGTAGVAFNQGFFVLGLSRTSIAHAAILTGLTPVQVLLLAALIGQEKLTARKVTGLAISLGGVALLQISGDETRSATLTGDLCIIMSGLSLAIYTVAGKRVMRRHDSVTMNTFAYTGSALLLSPVLFAGRFDFGHVSSAAWLSVTFMAVFPSVVSYLIYSYALAHIEASRVSAASYLQPLLATMLAIPVLGEHLTAPIIGGGALVLAGVYVTERG